MDDEKSRRERADNEVFLRGRLGDTPVEKALPSGDVLLSFSLTVTRPPGERVRVDSIECVALRAGVRRVVQRAAPGSELEIRGTLQRRFWRGPTGPASRYAVAADSARRVPAHESSAGAVGSSRVSRRRREAAASPARKRASG